jgi:integrase
LTMPSTCPTTTPVPTENSVWPFNPVRCALSKVLGTAEEWGHVSDNPVRKTRLARRDWNPERPVVTPQQVKRLITALPEPAKSIALLLVLTGLRIGELLALRWKNVNLEDKVLQVTETVQRHLRPTCKELGLPRTTWHALRHCHATLLDAVGAPLSTVQALLGHASPEVTRQIYLHAIPEEQQSSAERLKKWRSFLLAYWTQMEPSFGSPAKAKLGK